MPVMNTDVFRKQSHKKIQTNFWQWSATNESDQQDVKVWEDKWIWQNIVVGITHRTKKNKMQWLAEELNINKK